MKSSRIWPMIGALLASSAAAQFTARLAVDSEGRRDSNFTRVSSRGLSADGRWLAFDSDDSQFFNPGVFLRDLQQGTTVPISVSQSGQFRTGLGATVSADGNVVAFLSFDDQLVPGDTNQTTDVFVWERWTGGVRRVSVDSFGDEASDASTQAVVSGDGSCVAFMSWAPDLVTGDQNGWLDAFVHHLTTGLTIRVSVGSNGQEGIGGCFVGGGQCAWPMTLDISYDGRVVAFDSWLKGLVPNDTDFGSLDVFTHDWFTGSTLRASEAYSGGTSDHWSWSPSISSDGRWVAFQSLSSNLIPNGGPGGTARVFARDVTTGVTSRIGVTAAGLHADGVWPVLSSSGRFVAFWSAEPNLIPDDTNGYSDLFLQDLTSGVTRIMSRGIGGAQVPAVVSFLQEFAVTDSGQLAFMAGPGAIVGDLIGANFYNVVLHDPQLRSNAVLGYCTAKTNSLGCVPRMTVSGAPSSSAGLRFALLAENVRSHQSGMLLWSLSQFAAPFAGGTLCLGLPRRRTPPQDSGGDSPAADCSGSYDFYFDPAYVAGAGLSAGDIVHAQYYSRDPGFAAPNNVGLSDAIRFIVLP